MSAPPHDGWPAEGSRWEHWDDLLLACQLAGLRSGWNGISKRWDDTEPTKLVMRCHIGNGSSPSRCHWWILTARAEDSTRLEGAWLVSELRRENLESFRHSGHLGSGNFGISDPHKVCSLSRHSEDSRSLTPTTRTESTDETSQDQARQNRQRLEQASFDRSVAPRRGSQVEPIPS